MPAIRPATDIPAAARSLFAASPDPVTGAAGLLRLIDRGAIDRDGLLVAEDAGRLRGAVLVQLLGGGQAGVWPPAADSGDVAVALVAAALEWAAGNGAAVAQAGTAPDDPAGVIFERAGLTFTTHLVLMETILDRDAPTVPALPGLDLVHVSEMPAAVFEATVDATYDGTRDVPELNGLRPTADVIEGYRESCPTGDAEWFAATLDGTPAGVLLLAGGGPTWQLVYLGVAPAFRGRGLGSVLTALALHRAVAAGGQLVQLNADERNFPAIRLYTRYGFRTADRRAVFLKRLRPGG